MFYIFKNYLWPRQLYELRSYLYSLKRNLLSHYVAQVVKFTSIAQIITLKALTPNHSIAKVTAERIIKIRVPAKGPIIYSPLPIKLNRRKDTDRNRHYLLPFAFNKLWRRTIYRRFSQTSCACDFACVFSEISVNCASSSTFLPAILEETRVLQWAQGGSHGVYDDRSDGFGLIIVVNRFGSHNKRDQRCRLSPGLHVPSVLLHLHTTLNSTQWSYATSDFAKKMSWRDINCSRFTPKVESLLQAKPKATIDCGVEISFNKMYANYEWWMMTFGFMYHLCRFMCYFYTL